MREFENKRVTTKRKKIIRTDQKLVEKGWYD